MEILSVLFMAESPDSALVQHIVVAQQFLDG